MGVSLAPIGNPDGLKLRFVYWLRRRAVGTVPTPLKVVNARMPRALGLIFKFQKFHKRIQLEPERALRAGTLTSESNGCGGCVALTQSEAPREPVRIEKFHALVKSQTSPRFSDRERAALTNAEDGTRQKTVSDATFEALRMHVNNREIIEIMWLIAMQNFTNLGTSLLEIGSDDLCAIAQSETPREHHERPPVQNVLE